MNIPDKNVIDISADSETEGTAQMPPRSNKSLVEFSADKTIDHGPDGIVPDSSQLEAPEAIGALDPIALAGRDAAALNPTRGSDGEWNVDMTSLIEQMRGLDSRTDQSDMIECFGSAHAAHDFAAEIAKGTEIYEALHDAGTIDSTLEGVASILKADSIASRGDSASEAGFERWLIEEHGRTPYIQTRESSEKERGK